MHQNAWLLFDPDVCMNFEDYESDPGYETDPAQHPTPLKQFLYQSSSLPFGQHIPIESVNGPTYLTAQTLVQHVAYALSDKIFSYSPESFDLDLSLQYWRSENEKNAFGYRPYVPSLETRSGAGSLALGYMFSKDFDLQKRHIPQSIIASSSTLNQLRPQLDELSLLYSVANPVVAHVAAVDYSASSSGLVTDYIVAMQQAEELGLGLVASTSTYETQHMSLFATLLADIVPTIHTYDGTNVGRETTRVVDTFSRHGLYNAYKSITHQISGSQQKHLDNQGKLARLLDAFNEELGTDYKPFEYYGHSEPESVLVVFGSVEGSVAAQLAFALSQKGVKVGVINVRVYRPFLEDEFIDALPASVRTVSVLGQVKNQMAVQDALEHSRLYRDVLAAVSFSTGEISTQPAVVDVKYAREESWTPSKLLCVFQHMNGLTLDDWEDMNSPERPRFDLLGPAVKRYTFWDTDNSVLVNVPSVVGQLLSRGLPDNVTLRQGHDNLEQGGVVRTDIRSSAKSIEAPYSITASNITIVGEERLLQDFDIVGSLQSGGTMIVKLPGAKGQDIEKLEKRLPAEFRAGVIQKEAQLFVFDPAASPMVAENGNLETMLVQLAFLRFAWSEQTFSKLGKLAAINGDIEILQALAKDLDVALWRVETPESWVTTELSEASSLPTDLNVNSFVAFDKAEVEQPTFLQSWIAAAKGFAFKEVTGTKTALRPDLGFKTATVHVKEHRRLTPLTYDRNIFHIEFDLGDSGLTYNIGEALGIHAENNELEVQEFIKWYGIDPLSIVEVASREDPNIVENRTVYQSLLQNIDIFGRPPKRFYEALAEFASDPKEYKELLTLGTGATGEAVQEFKRRAEVDTITYADVLLEFSSARPSFHDIVRMVSPMKRREYSIASSQKVTPTSVSLLIVTVGWVDSKSRDRFGQATRYLNSLPVGAPVTVSIKPSVMKLPQKTTAPIIMAGLGTGLAPFRAFV